MEMCGDWLTKNSAVMETDGFLKDIHNITFRNFYQNTKHVSEIKNVFA